MCLTGCHHCWGLHINPLGGYRVLVQAHSDGAPVLCRPDHLVRRTKGE